MDDNPQTGHLPEQPLNQPLIDEFVGAAHGDLAKVTALLDQYPDLIHQRASWNETAIEAAAQTRALEIVNLLLARGAKLDICTAALLGQTEMVKVMLESDRDAIDATGSHEIPLLYYPVIAGHRELAGYLLEQNIDVNAGEGSMTALHGAVFFDLPEMVELLLEHGAQADLVDFNGKTALDLAYENQRVTIMEMLRQRAEEMDEEE